MQTNNKLREALVIVAKQLTDATEDENFGEDVMYLVGCMRTMSQKCRAALAEPVKNCEVGTAEEQEDRFRRYCNSRGTFCGDCPLYNNRRGECRFAWAQMPYEEGGEKVNSCVIIGGNDKAHAAVSIMGRESINKQCYECANCKEPTTGWDGSKFRCAFLGKDFGTWHYDVPNECPCKGKGWEPEEKEGGDDADE